VSADPVGRQKEFDDRNGLGFPLLSDTSKKVYKQFGIKRPGPIPGKRATFVIGTDRRLLAAITSETKMEIHADEALAALRGSTA